ncbi:MAG: N-formylglutamate amidohydrolase [Anaerolineae bacterium]|nr:N-formylglutamate amidohydrolase [Anaerolineae bacterium]
MTTILPLAILSPHGGLATPLELKERVALTPEQVFNEADAYIDDLFDFRDRVLYYETFPFGRTLIDVNRPADATLHHRKGDGVVKTVTGYGDAVYRHGMEPDAALEQALISRYWQPWHERLAQIARDDRVKLVLDCHSMAAVGPTTYDDPGALRPRVMVANLGDEQGNLHPERARLSASAEIAHFTAKTLGDSLADVPELAATGALYALNHPFWGGWDLWLHGTGAQPWLMIELNRGLYVGAQHATAPVVPLQPALRTHMREHLWQAITAITDFVITGG